MEKAVAIRIIRDHLHKLLSPSDWQIIEEEEHIGIKHQKNQDIGFRLSVTAILSKAKSGEEEEAINQAVQNLVKMARASMQEKQLRGNEHQIFPVLRSASHPLKKNEVSFVYDEHTAESKVFYALDLGNTYVLIDENMVKHSSYHDQDIRSFAMDNLKKLDTSYKTDEVAGNLFYFFSQPDGYAASRVLNHELLAFMKRKVKGEMGIAIPHQDVLVIADIQTEVGYQVLSRMNIDFCIKGDVPISPLPFVFSEEGLLEPIMVMSNPGAKPRIIHNRDGKG